MVKFFLSKLVGVMAHVSQVREATAFVFKDSSEMNMSTINKSI